MAVSLANDALGSVEQATARIREPVSSTYGTIKEQSKVVADKAAYTYQRRHEFAPHIIGTSTLLGGGIMTLRRGRIAGVVGATIAGGSAYAVVYDKISLERIPDMIFGTKDD